MSLSHHCSSTISRFHVSLTLITQPLKGYVALTPLSVYDIKIPCIIDTCYPAFKTLFPCDWLIFTYLQPYNKEEADGRIFLHVRKITIITADTDVVVIACYIFFDLDVDELWIEYGIGKNSRFLFIFMQVFQVRKTAEPYTNTGCDTVS